MFRRKRDAEDSAPDVEGITPDADLADGVGADAVSEAEIHTYHDAETAPPADDAVEEDYDDEDDEYEERPRDPLVGWMTLVSVLLVLVAVVATGSIVFFLLGMRGAPRTAAERLIISSESAVSEGPTTENFIKLGYAYLTAGRYADAQSTVKRGRIVKDISEFDLLEGDILRAQGSNSKAVKMYEKAAKRNEVEVTKARKALEARGIYSPMSRTTLVNILIGKGESLEALGRSQDALKAFSEAVKYDGTNAYVLVRVGDLSVELGKRKEAKKAYEEALRFIPDYAPALKGLDKVDDSTKE